MAATLSAILLATRAANDQAAKAAYPASMLFPSWTVGSAAGETYYIRATGKPDRIVVYLHSWSGDYTQVAAFPELALDNAVVIAPNFNGPNLASNPNVANTCASDDALARIRTVISEVQYKTGLKRVYLVGASGGGMAGLAFMGKYPGIVHRASIWVPIWDMAAWYGEADANFQADMMACFGHAPSGPYDLDYWGRSPVARMIGFEGPATVVLNAASDDTTVPTHHSRDARDFLLTCPDVTVEYHESAMGHTFIAQTAVQQILLE